MECLGGNGYVEEGLAARLYRELPLNAIWEGSGNVMCLDLLRVLEQDPAAVEGVLDALGQAASGERRLETALRELRALLADPADLERRARHFVATLARATAAALLLEPAPSAVAAPFIPRRLAGPFHTPTGAGPAPTHPRPSPHRATPATPPA